MENKVRVLSDEEGKLLLDALEGRDRIATMLVLYDGLRSSEVFRVRWDDIDFERGLLRVYSSTQKKMVFKPLTETLGVELKDYAANSTEAGLFENLDVDSYGRYFQMLNRKFKRLLSADVTFKTLRHSFAMQLIRAGKPSDFVKIALGYSRNSIVSIYGLNAGESHS